MELCRGLDLNALYAAIRVRTHTTGRPAIDPALLMALWLYATIDGVGSAREIEPRTIEELWKAVGSICDLYTPDECWNYLRHAGYASD